MQLLRTYAAASDFLADVRPFLEEQEVVSGLMLGLALRLASEPLLYGQPPYFAAVMQEGRPALAALMTPPHNLILHAEREHVAAALGLVARDLMRNGPPVAGALGPSKLADLFALLWTDFTGIPSRVTADERIYVLREVIHPRYSSGELRVAEGDDLELVTRWQHAFHDEALPQNPSMPDDLLRARIASRDLFLWQDGSPVSMAMRSRPTSRGVSIGDVYTPPEYRRRGYASSCVAAMSQCLLDTGFEYCTLFTNLSNPTSNAIYQKIGYQPVCDFREIKFL